MWHAELSESAPAASGSPGGPPLPDGLQAALLPQQAAGQTVSDSHLTAAVAAGVPAPPPLYGMPLLPPPAAGWPNAGQLQRAAAAGQLMMAAQADHNQQAAAATAAAAAAQPAVGEQQQAPRPGLEAYHAAPYTTVELFHAGEVLLAGARRCAGPWSQPAQHVHALHAAAHAC